MRVGFARRLIASLNFHEVGRPRPMLGPNARVAAVPPYILIYDYGQDDDALVLLRVLHERREITQDLVRGRQ
jgi:plasmid stabilization system protein ParE